MVDMENWCREVFRRLDMAGWTFFSLRGFAQTLVCEISGILCTPRLCDSRSGDTIFFVSSCIQLRLLISYCVSMFVSPKDLAPPLSVKLCFRSRIRPCQNELLVPQIIRMSFLLL
jgi:hypothetical protein